MSHGINEPIKQCCPDKITEMLKQKVKIQSLESEIEKIKEENLRMRNWKNCKHDINSFCISTAEDRTKPCPCDNLEIKK